eukprot:TRINITY_DN94109_c0_g1_i1.p1 TRINITY_DN94109_c0_g1~~TRINITY_DN94109_c0_g1_i1.p1  ORF type:complete len:409 (+),score=92.28 TRINITY_DN94109_c0_g1_i1:46-1272(+)
MASQCVVVSKPEELTFESCLGRGYFGEVWRSRLARNGSLFAVKKVRLSLISENRLSEQLDREIKILYVLQHPRIVKLHFNLKDDKFMYLGMEFASGGSLFEKLNATGKFPTQRAVRYFAETCEALEYIHNLADKVIHRDIKPENILLDEKDHVKLADFGWANMIQAEKRDTFCGTLDYLPPEMIMGTGHDESVDMWNMGVLLYELISGQSPFGSGSKETTCKLILSVDLRFPAFVEADVRDLVAKLCKKKPAERLTARQALAHKLVTKHFSSPAGQASPSEGPIEAAPPASGKKTVEEEPCLGQRHSVVARGLLSDTVRLEAEKEQLLTALTGIEEALMRGNEDLDAADGALRDERCKRAAVQAECHSMDIACKAREKELQELRRRVERKSRVGWLSKPFRSSGGYQS